MSRRRCSSSYSVEPLASSGQLRALLGLVDDVVVAVVPQHDLAFLPVESDTVLHVHVGLEDLGIPSAAHKVRPEALMPWILAEQRNALGDCSCERCLLAVNDPLELRGDYKLRHLLRIAEKIPNGICRVSKGARTASRDVRECLPLRLLPSD